MRQQESPSQRTGRASSTRAFICPRSPRKPPQPSLTANLQKVELRIARWSGFRLSLLGRASVAKQVLTSMVIYHATFISVPEHLLIRLFRTLHMFVAGNKASHQRHAGTLAPLFPGKEACICAAKDGGIALVDIRSQM
ncbi:g5650 [Coccomyxa elongata]